MDTPYQPNADIDVSRMFDQYLYKRAENTDSPIQNSYFSNGYTNTPHQSFLPPSFGDEFEIPPLNPPGGTNGSSPGGQPSYNSSLLMGQKRSSEAMSPYQHQSQLYSMNSPLNPRCGYGVQSGGYNALHMLQHGYSAMAAKSASPKGDQPHSEDSDDSHGQLVAGMKRPSPEPTENGLSKLQKKPKPQKKKKKKDPNEPQKPVSAYALFFRDTQAAIKGQNPNASFGEVSKIVASMWDSLDVEHKNVYKKKTEAAKKDYLKALAAYRASLVSKGGNENEVNQQGGGQQPLTVPYPHGGYGGGYGAYGGYSPPGGLPSPPTAASPQAAKKPAMMPNDNRTPHHQQGMMGKHMGQQGGQTQMGQHTQKHQQNMHQQHQSAEQIHQQHMNNLHQQQAQHQQHQQLSPHQPHHQQHQQMDKRDHQQDQIHSSHMTQSHNSTPYRHQDGRESGWWGSMNGDASFAHPLTPHWHVPPPLPPPPHHLQTLFPIPTINSEV